MPDSVPRTLKQRVFKASAWTAAGYGLSQLIRFGSNLLMTRLLVPEMFGVMAIAMMVMYGLALFSDIGLRQSIVQSKRGNDAVFLNTAWAIQIVRGVLICFFGLGVSLLIVVANRIGLFPMSSVYAEPILPHVIAIVSITGVISGFESTKLAEASRTLSLGRITRIEIISQLAGLLCMFAWVSIDRSIWVLVAGGLCSTFVKVILSHVWLRGVANRWQWDNSAFHEIIRFGKWIFVSSILGFLVSSGDRLLLGGLVSTTVLGIYVIAFYIFSSAEQMLTKIVAEVSFPALSEVARERPTDLKVKYYQFHDVIASFAYVCAGVLMIAGQALIGLLYDPRYAQAGWMLEILAVSLLTVPVHVATQCFMALGMPKLISHLGAIRLIVLVVITPIGFHLFGLPGALWGIVLSYSSSLPTTFFYKVRYGLFDLRKELVLLPLILVGMIAGKALQLVLRP
jgi:O-antigen/teichoic acid export membrane protein